MTASATVSPACFGVLCPQHGRCARYAAIDFAPGWLPRIGTCQQGRNYPMFMLQARSADAPTSGTPLETP